MRAIAAREVASGPATGDDVPMQLALYVHPFDLTALAGEGGLARLRELGFAELAMACSYHDGRWLTPWHPERRVRFLEDGTVHFRPDPGAGYGELQPLPSSEVPANGPSPLERLCADAPAAGLAVRAWTVFGHDTRLGTRHPACTVENAHGDRYPYALCPAQPAVQQFHLALVRDLARHRGLGAIELEALGQMGINHSSHHDKKSFTPKGLLAFALSACFCPACCDVQRALGADPAAMRAAVRAFVDAQIRDADAMAPPKAPAGPDALDDGQRGWVAAVVAGREHTARGLAGAVVAASGACARAVQVHPDPWFTGSQLSLAAAQAFPAGDERVLTCYGDGPAAIEQQLAATRATWSGPLRVCVWPKAPEFTSDEDLKKLRASCEAHGVGALAVYHLGLLPWRTVERVAKMFRA